MRYVLLGVLIGVPAKVYQIAIYTVATLPIFNEHNYEIYKNPYFMVELINNSYLGLYYGTMILVAGIIGLYLIHRHVAK